MCYRMSLALIILSLVTGCAVGPNYVRPTAPVPEGYKEIEGWKVAQPRDDVLRGAWWEMFDDPTLSSLMERINISNQNVIAAEAALRQARALVEYARASFFPVVTTAPTFTRSLRSSDLSPPAGGPATGASTHPATDYLLPVSVSWEIDVFGRIRRTVESNRASAEASAADLEAVRLTSQAQLAQTYFQVRALDAQTKLLNETIIAYQKSLELTRNRYAGGVASRGDVLQAETLLKSTQAQAIDVGVGRSQLEHAMALLIGVPPSEFSLPFAPLVATPPAIPPGVPSELLERRPDIAGAERRAAAANAQIGVAVAAYFPKITINASGGYESWDLPNLLTWPSHFWSLGPQLAQTLFVGGAREALTEGARAAYDASVATYRLTVLNAFKEVEDNLAALRILEEEARAQDEAVEAARKSVEIGLNQYKEGTISYLNVIVLQTTALGNERVAVNIVGQRMSAAVLLVKALGGGWHVPYAGDRAGLIEGKDERQ